uniref:Uncharacterized protein n=1 Tax=Cacopsylla melanoneura TaxID=428564 RepID=A0A8D8U951_9HEMI
MSSITVLWIFFQSNLNSMYPKWCISLSQLLHSGGLMIMNNEQFIIKLYSCIIINWGFTSPFQQLGHLPSRVVGNQPTTRINLTQPELGREKPAAHGVLVPRWVTHPSTIPARRCLTSDPVHSCDLCYM